MQRWGCKTAKVVQLIRSGQLEAFNITKTLGGRPRFRITPEALKHFEQQRSATPAPKQPRRYRRPKGSDFVEYI